MPKLGTCKPGPYSRGSLTFSISLHFHDSLHLTTLNEREKGDRGDTARVLDKLSKALELDCDYEQSRKTRQEADMIHDRLIESGKYTFNANDDEKWELLACIKFR